MYIYANQVNIYAYIYIYYIYIYIYIYIYYSKLKFYLESFISKKFGYVIKPVTFVYVPGIVMFLGFINTKISK